MQSQSRNVLGLHGNIQKNKEIGEIENWGPLFRISFDLVFHSKPTVYKYYSILAFKGYSGRSDCCNVGDRAPTIFYHPTESDLLTIATAIGDNGNHFNEFEVSLEINKKYNFVIEQKFVNGKVVSTLFKLYQF